MALDIVGDVHGCSWELEQLAAELGYRRNAEGLWNHPQQRRMALLGDLVDRGPDSYGALVLVKELVDSGVAFIAAVGNHDFEIYQGTLLGKPTKVFYGLQRTLDQVADLGVEQEFAATLEELFAGREAFTVIDDQKLILVHAALRPDMLTTDGYLPDWSDPDSQLALYGETVQIEGEPFPRKGYGWANDWQQPWTIVYGHDVISEMPIIRGQNENVVGIDSGASYGGRLTALRWPEREFVSISARDVYPEHESDFPEEAPGTVNHYSWEDILSWEHKNTKTLHYLHGKRKTPEMSIPRSILIARQ